MKLIDKIKTKCDKRWGGRARYEAFKSDLCFRTMVFCAMSTVTTAAFAVYNGVFGILNKSVWYGTFAAYLIVIVLLRIAIVTVYKAALSKCSDGEESQAKKLKIYLASGVVFLPISIALLTIIALMLNAQKPVVASEILAITTAAYAFIKVITSIVNFAKAKTFKDPLVQTARNVSLIDAFTSVIMLEATLITTFGTLTHDMYVLIAISGFAVCVLALAIGTYMIVRAAKKLRHRA